MKRKHLVIGGAVAASLLVLWKYGFWLLLLLRLLWPFALLVAAYVWFGARLMKRLAAKPTTHGTAEWATPAYLREEKLLGGDGLRLGTMPTERGDELVRYTGDRHILTVAPTRSGKGTTVIIPNLLTRRCSALVVDPKGENALITAKARAAMGQTIHVVDPWCIASDAVPRASRFNPLDWLVQGDPDITENAMLLADALVVPDGKGDSFWTEEAKALLQGLILYVATDEHEAGMRHLGRVRDLLLLDGEDMSALFQRMTQSAHHVVASTGARSLQKEEKLLANVVASAQAQTHFLDSARIRESLSASDFKFEDLKRSAMTVYLVLPADRLATFGRWLRLLIQQAITVNARDIRQRPALPVLFLLDEMQALGRLSTVEQAYRLMAGFGMQLWGIAQDASGLKEIYGEGWEGFIANSGVIQYFGSPDRMTAEYFSALCGETTVASMANATAVALKSWSLAAIQNSTQTAGSAQRKLAFADELMRLPRGRQLVLIENHPPIMCDKRPWFEDTQLSALGRNLHHEGGAR
jgi:type IV secretion system protein VirD4